MKKVFYLLVYLIFFLALPFGVAMKLTNKNNFSAFGERLGFYVLFISPLLFPVFYKLAKLKNKKEKFLFILFGFIIPFVLLYYYFWLDFQRNFYIGF